MSFLGVGTGLKFVGGVNPASDVRVIISIVIVLIHDIGFVWGIKIWFYLILT